MKTPIHFTVKNQHLWLSAERAVFWEEEKALIVSDMHFGKTGHFRKAGVAVPQSVFKEDLQRLVDQLQYFQPATLIIVGDLFHSDANKELELFLKWRNDLPQLNIELVKGNHDILKPAWYTAANIAVNQPVLTIHEFCFQHDFGKCLPGVEKKNDHYLFSGHIHPGVRISGLGKQSLRFPCFYFTPEYCVLPAFSKFTGVAIIDPQEHEHVFAIVNNSLIKI